MAKITRSVLKSLVKECLVEILVEGIDGSSADLLEESLDHQPAQTRQKKPDPMIEINQRRKQLDSRMVDTRQKQLDEQNAKNISMLTEDPMMAEIFADTAATTLQEQIESKGKMSYRTPGDHASQVVSQNDPSDLFSGAGNWADLAFSNQKPSQ